MKRVHLSLSKKTANFVLPTLSGKKRKTPINNKSCKTKYIICLCRVRVIQCVRKTKTCFHVLPLGAPLSCRYHADSQTNDNSGLLMFRQIPPSGHGFFLILFLVSIESHRFLKDQQYYFLLWCFIAHYKIPINFTM